MTTSIRTKFNLGIMFFFVIILVLLILSTFQLNKLSKKTSNIFKENHFSVVYARDMTEALNNINQEYNNCFILSKNPDSAFLVETFELFDKSLLLEKNNITEVGEDKLVSSIEKGYKKYRNSIETSLKQPKSVEKVMYLNKMEIDLGQQLMLLSQMNAKAIEIKTNDAKESAKKAFGLMTIVGTFCFLIALSFTYSFASYFSSRFFQLHNGIKEIVSSNYGQRLYFDGHDEFYEIAVAFNLMAEKMDKSLQVMPLSGKADIRDEMILQDISELKRVLAHLKILQEQANELISKFKEN
jgi:two-component system, NtrC family, sensor histidine kinase KinB